LDTLNTIGNQLSLKSWSIQASSVHPKYSRSLTV